MNSQSRTYLTELKDFLALQNPTRPQSSVSEWFQMFKSFRSDLNPTSWLTTAKPWRRRLAWNNDLSLMPLPFFSLCCLVSPFPSCSWAHTCISISLHLSSSLSWYAHTFAHALSSADWLLSLCPIFVDDFREQRSLWPSDNNVLDQYILCACSGVFLLCVSRLLRRISLESLNTEPLIPLPKVCRPTVLPNYAPSHPNYAFNTT